jgi:hypothetical protein
MIWVAASADVHNRLYVQEDDLSRSFRRAALAFAERALVDGRLRRFPRSSG